MNEYQSNYFKTGQVKWCSNTPEKRGELVPQEMLIITKEDAIDGDHKRSANRQVTLIQQENINAVQSFLEMDKIDPRLLRRNIVVEGINLGGFQGRQIKLGDEVILEITGECEPCNTMERNLGKGGYNAMWGNGGYTCKVVEPGRVKIGDSVTPLV